MSDKTIRLRVVLQRNGLPEDRFMLPVSLEDGPTVATLLEQVNSTYFPLETDQWGLEDYAVYRRASDGTTFECLHFSPIHSLFRDDDQALVRPLQTDDLRRRRLGGRFQISSDGKHLLDGVPFGRPLLRSPPSRPPIYIPPRKKRRLLHDRDDPIDHAHEESSHQENRTFEADDGERSMLLLTNDSAQPNDADDNDGEDVDDDADEEYETDLSEDNSDLEDEEDLAEELQALREENATTQGESPDDAIAASPRVSPLRRTQNQQTDPLDGVSALRAAFPSAPLDVCKRILEASGGGLREAYTTLCDGFAPELSDSTTLAQIRPGRNMPNLSPRRPESSENSTAIALARNTLGDVADGDNPGDDDENGIDEISAFARQFDHRGLPPGTISSGKGPSHTVIYTDSLASSKPGGDSEDTSTTLVGSHEGKPSPHKVVEEDDDETSSSGTSSSSEDEESEEANADESDEASEDDSSFNSDSSSASSDSDRSGHDDVLSQADSSSSEEGDSGPEQAPTKRTASSRLNVHREPHGAQDTNAKQSESRRAIADDTSSDSSSDTESSEDDSSSDSESDEGAHGGPPTTTLPKTPPTAQSAVPRTATSQSRAALGERNPPPVPPGQGKESTKSRNARRRAAQKAKKQEQAQARAQAQAQAQATAQQQVRTAPTPSIAKDGPGSSTPADQALATQQSLFEAKRKALLDAIASGGVEVDSKGEQVHGNRTTATTDVAAGSKRKLEEAGQPAAHDKTPRDTPVSEATSAPSDASQKRRRMDVGAGRRLVFGALGIRNPKGPDDAETVRAKLMEGVRPHANPRLEQDAPRCKEAVDLDSWREVIVYRAVECCQEGIELSEPPFPFVQRWDPQQQSLWSGKGSNKRGGGGKRAQRDQVHFYSKVGASGKKRKHDEALDWDADGYDDTFNGIEDEPPNADVQLNYDDIVEPSRETNDPVAEASQFTDMEDLPSLPRDLSSLPTLRPGDVQPGMVITWKKWSCSRATNWEPRLSDVTGVVVRIDDDVTGVEVCLAKRDRELDGTEKQYDPLTGQRVYDRFEAPDLDEDDDEAAAEQDEGYRTLSFAEMQEPRVLQQPLPSDQALPSVEGARPRENAPQARGTDCTEPFKELNGNATSQRKVTSQIPESLPGGKHNAGNKEDVVATCVEPSRPAGEHASLEETRTSSNSTEHQPGQGQQDPALSSMPSIPSVSQVNSYSQQLRETTSQPNDASSFDPSIIESSGYKGDVDTEALDTAPLLSDSVYPTDRSEAPAFDAGEGELITGTPKVAHPRVMVPSSASSIGSGRQLDYTMEQQDGPESLRVTEADDDAPIMEDGDEEGVSSPTPTPTHAKTTQSTTDGKATAAKTPSNSADRSSREPSSPSSIESISTLFSNAKTSRQTQSPAKSQQTTKTPRNPVVAKTEGAVGYDEAMRKLDEQSDDESDQDESPIIPDSLPPVDNGDRDAATGALNEDEECVNEDKGPLLPKVRQRPATTQIKISPPPPKRVGGGRGTASRRREASSQLTIPPGSQVIDLLSSSDAEPEPEPLFTEDYADDDVDGTYLPKSSSQPKGSSSLPKGPGWITKSSAAASGSQPPMGRSVKRGPSASQSQAQSQSQGSAAMSFSPPSSFLPEIGRKGARIGGRRKTSARF